MPLPTLLHRGSPEDESEVPRVLVMTMVRDEALMLPRWLRYYSEQVGIENIVILDDNTTDSSTDNLECTVHRLPPLPGPGYEGVRMNLISGLAGGFLALYDFVIFVDADEFLVPDPNRHADLLSFLAARQDREVIAPMALNVLHVPSVEGPLRPDEPVLGQRQFAKFTPIMCKPSIKQTTAEWKWASHGIKAPYEVDRELYMLHLKFADRRALRRVAARRRALVDSERRAPGSNWSRDADEMVRALRRASKGVDLDLVPEFDPADIDLDGIVETRKGWARSVGRGQVRALKTQPLSRVPASLLGRI